MTVVNVEYIKDKEKLQATLNNKKQLSGSIALGKPLAVIEVEEIVGGHKITVTDPSGSQELEIMNGEPGPQGETGEQGPQGEPGEQGPAGKTPVKGEDYWTEEDKDEIKQYIEENSESGGSGSTQSIIDVVSLPTENINENAFYRLLTAKFLYGQFIKNDWTLRTVESLPETGEMCWDGTVAIAYYSIEANNTFGYVNEMVSSVMGVPVGWYPADVLIPAVGQPYGGIITDITEAADNTVYTLLTNVIYSYKDGVWQSIDIIGWRGEGESSEIFNHLSNIASGSCSHAEGLSTTASGDFSHAEGSYTTASGDRSHAEGLGTTAYGSASHTEGDNTTASGYTSHAEGQSTTASGNFSHAEGKSTNKASGYIDLSQNTSLNDIKTAWKSNLFSLAYGDGSHVEGDDNIAYGNSSHAEGYHTTASGYTSHAEGLKTTASGESSHAEGERTTASGDHSHAEGSYTTASGARSHAEGASTTAYGSASHAEGSSTTASDVSSHAEGSSTTASAHSSHAEGFQTTASENYSHAEGSSSNKASDVIDLSTSMTIDDIKTAMRSKPFSLAYGNSSHVEGSDNIAYKPCAHAEGLSTLAIGSCSHAEGYRTEAKENASHAEGFQTTASGIGSHTEGEYTTASGDSSHAEGSYTTASGARSHAEGSNTTASGETSHVEGRQTTASGRYSHAEGSSSNKASAVVDLTKTMLTLNDIKPTWTNKKFSLAFGESAHAEGKDTIAFAIYSHAEGNETMANGQSSHAEGYGASTNGRAAHAEGYYTTASGLYSHAEGYMTYATGTQSHVEGYMTRAYGTGSHAEGSNTTAASEYQHVQGKYNVEDAAKKYAHIVGNGDADDSRSNAHTLDWEGNAWYQGDVYVGSNSGINRDEGSKKLATEEFVLQNAGSGGSGSTQAIIDVTELPTENINENAFYRLLTGSLVTNQVTQTMYTCYCVETLPESGEPATNLDKTEGNAYYNLSDEELYGYVNDTLSVGLGVPSGWYPANVLLGALGYEYGGVISNILEDPMDDKYRFLLKYAVYSYKDEWASHETIGEAGTGLSAEIFNYSNNIASGDYSHAEGANTTASSFQSHAEGCWTTASGDNSHAEGNYTIAASPSSHAEGYKATASGDYSHAEGWNTTASGGSSHAEGFITTASGNYSHAEGDRTTASGDNSHAEGESTTASGKNSHAQGYSANKASEVIDLSTNPTLNDIKREWSGKQFSLAYGNSTHVEGVNNIAYGHFSHAEGNHTIASGATSHAEGERTIASGNQQHVQGKYNVDDSGSKYAHIVGNGGNETARSNAHTLDWEGNAWFAGKIKVGGTGQDDPNSVEIATVDYVNSLFAEYATEVASLIGGIEE